MLTEMGLGGSPSAAYSRVVPEWVQIWVHTGRAGVPIGAQAGAPCAVHLGQCRVQQSLTRAHLGALHAHSKYAEDTLDKCKYQSALTQCILWCCANRVNSPPWPGDLPRACIPKIAVPPVPEPCARPGCVCRQLYARACSRGCNSLWIGKGGSEGLTYRLFNSTALQRTAWQTLRYTRTRAFASLQD